jgi:hypothetical protein
MNNLAILWGPHLVPSVIRRGRGWLGNPVVGGGLVRWENPLAAMNMKVFISQDLFQDVPSGYD